MIELFIPGEPQGKQRARVFPIKTKAGVIVHRGVTPERTANYEALVKQMFVSAYPGFVPLEGPLSLGLEARLLIPRSASKKAQALMAAGELLPEKRPDVDNLMKTVADALEGLAFRNDSQIVDARVRKVWSLTPGMRVRLESLARSEK